MHQTARAKIDPSSYGNYLVLRNLLGSSFFAHHEDNASNTNKSNDAS